VFFYIKTTYLFIYLHTIAYFQGPFTRVVWQLHSLSLSAVVTGPLGNRRSVINYHACERCHLQATEACRSW